MFGPALLLVCLVGCRRPQGGAADAAGQSVSESARTDAGPADVVVVSPSVPDVPWVTINDALAPDPPARVGGIVVRPEIELPVRSASVEVAFPYVALRTRGLPAISADGERVAHVYGPTKCCRGTGYTEIALHIMDSKTGATRTKLILWTLDDEARLPQLDENYVPGSRRLTQGVRPEKDEAALEKNRAAYNGVLARRVAVARAAISGEWTTLASLAVDHPEDGTHHLRGEDVAISLPATPAFPPIAVVQCGTTHSFPGARFRLTLHACPDAPMALRLEGGYALRGKPLAIIETQQGYAAPDGCEGSSMHLLAWR